MDTPLTHASTDFLIGPMRVLTKRGMTFFHVASPPTPYAELDKALDILLDKLYAARRQTNLIEAGPDITRYYQLSQSEPDLYQMEVGISVRPATLPAGEAQVTTLPPYHCAELLLWGSLAHIVQAYQSLTQAIQAAGLEQTGESREWNYYFEGVDSPNNLIGLSMGVR